MSVWTLLGLLPWVRERRERAIIRRRLGLASADRPVRPRLGRTRRLVKDRAITPPSLSHNARASLG